LSFTTTIFNIDITGTQTPDTFDDLVAAYIHVGARPGTNAPFRWGFFGSPDATLLAVSDNDVNPDNVVVTPFACGVGGTFSSIWNLPERNDGTTLTTNLPDILLPGILAGNSYIDFHTVQFPGGEIRGQFQRVPDVASTAALLALALVVLIGLQWRGAPCCLLRASVVSPINR
jgi:hypothetical protein